MVTFETYDPEDYYDELIDADGKPRPGVHLLVDKIASLPVDSGLVQAFR